MPTLSPIITCNPNWKKTNQTLSHAISTSQSQRWGRSPLRWLIGEERERGIRKVMRVRKKRDCEEVKKKREHVRKKKEENSWQRNGQERIDNQREERETELKSIFTFLAFGTEPFQIWNSTVHMLAFKTFNIRGFLAFGVPNVKNLLMLML